MSERTTPFVTLALSGGGSRAIAFHLGCLRALRDRRVLDHVRVISSVSGGSVIAAGYAYWDLDFEAFDGRVVELLKKGLQGGILAAALHPVEAGRMLATLVINGGPALLIAAVNLVLNLLRFLTGAPTTRVQRLLSQLARSLPVWGTLTTALERSLRSSLFASATMAEVRRADLEVLINACDLPTGTAFRFGSRSSGGWRYGRIVGADIAVAKAVAASAAFPPLLAPLVETFQFERGGQRHRHKVLLTDGGVFDNLGTNPLEPGRDPGISVNTYPTTHIISLNAGSGQFEGEGHPLWWGPRLLQSFVAVHRKVQDASYARLFALREAGDLHGFIMVYLGQDDARLPAPPPDLIPRDAVRRYPTDFAAMSETDIDCLARRGEQLTHLMLDHYWQAAPEA
jgi:NTE family protein